MTLDVFRDFENAGMKIGVKESNDKFTNKIKNDLTKLGLKSNRHFTIEKN